MYPLFTSNYLKSLTASPRLCQCIIAGFVAFLTITAPFTPAFAATTVRSSSSSSASFGYDNGGPRAAFTALENKSGSDALRAMSGSDNAVLIDIVTGLAMGLDDSPYDFNAAQQFLLSHSYWPESDRNAIARQAEKKMTGDVDTQTLLAFFALYPPQTADGFNRYIDALNATRQTQKIAPAIRNRWRETNMGEDEQNNFLSRYGSSISIADTHYRLDRLLWNKYYDHAQRLYPLISTGMISVAQARIALSKGNANAPKLVEHVPSSLQNDPGLMYERTKWRRKHDDMQGAYALIKSAGTHLGRPEEWWDERNAISRDLIINGDYAGAYQLVARSGLSKGQEYSDAEFLAGWLALRYLNNPADALMHFQHLNSNATAPITFARAAYWIGRSYEALGQTPQAQNWLTRASVFGTTYYGQLAAARLYPTSQLSANVAPIPQQAISNFQNLLTTAIVQQLVEVGARKIAERFALAFANNAREENDFRLMAGLALQLDMPETAVKVAKAAAKKQIALPVEGYPVLSIVESNNTPLAHAIIRQESQFDARIASTSNAQGLMQLLPSTAKHVANKANISVDPTNLYDPETNVRLGTAYIEELLGNFNGSLPLTIGAYNAGPGRMREWLGKFGDPRGKDVDAAIDWVETIPFSETRNYVQRVMEALQLYRAKLSGGTALLGIGTDLTN